MITVYSAICGNKDKPRSDVTCFSAYDRFRDPRLNAKIYKVLAHKFVDAEYSIWIDGNIRLTVPPKQLVEMMDIYDCAVFTHPERSDIYEEAEFVAKIGKDKSDIVIEQINAYRQAGFTKRDLAMCGILVRRHTESIARLNERWWAEVCRYSVRDQISFPVVFDGHVKYLPTEPMNGGRYHKRIPHDHRF